MIIVSQDKKAIVNFDNVNKIRVSKTVILDNTYYISVDCSDVLGTYDTEERAKEVLQEIVMLYTKIEIEDGNIAYKVHDYPKVYEMPEE